jgi:hypothetical protein
LELKKCFYYILSWKRDKNGTATPERKEEQQIEQLELKLTTKIEPVKITQREVNESHKTLGTHKCIMGDETEQYKVLLEKSNGILTLAENSQFKRQQAWMGYSCFYIPSMVYSLVAVSMN